MFVWVLGIGICVKEKNQNPQKLKKIECGQCCINWEFFIYVLDKRISFYGKCLLGYWSDQWIRVSGITFRTSHIDVHIKSGFRDYPNPLLPRWEEFSLRSSLSNLIQGVFWVESVLERNISKVEKTSYKTCPWCLLGNHMRAMYIFMHICNDKWDNKMWSSSVRNFISWCRIFTS